VAEIIKTVIDVDINTSGAAAELRSLQQQINAFNLTLNKGQLEQGQASRVFAEGLRNSINTGGFFRAELVKMQTAAGALDSTLRKGQGTLGQFFSASFNKQGGMAAEVFALASERARTMQTQFIATAKASKGMQEALAVRPLTAFSADAAVSAQRMQILNSLFKQGTTGLINFGKNVQWTGRQLMVGFTIPLTIFGTTAGRVFSDLEKQAVSFKKVYGDIFTTPAELEENFKAVQGLSREFTKYGIAAKDTLGLAAQAAAAGRQNTDLTDAVRESTRLATLGQMDQNAALETTISLQSAFRLSGQELADTINFLNMVENQTVVSLQDIAAAIPRVAPVIKGLGGDVKDLTVFLAAMQEGGVSAEQGANALKSGLGSLINPTKAATDVLAGFKINLDSIIQTNRGDLMGTVTAFSEALSTLDEFSRQQALESLFGKFQYARLGALFENISREGSQAQQVISTLGYSTEQLAKSAEKELSTVEQAFSTQLTGAIERLKIAIAPLGEIFVKMAIPLVNMVTKIVDAFNRLPEGVKNVAALATVLGGVLLPAATMIFGLFANLIGTFAKFSHSMGMFGVTLLKKGPLAAIKSLTQSANYLSLSEIDAANAARQLGSATELANAALLSQVGSANSADVAIKNLTNSYRVLISEQTRASQAQSFLFGTGQAASNLGKGSAAASVATTIATRGKSRIKAVGLNKGGSVFTPDNSNTVPGSGNTDTVPAMLTPGEFVVNKESTKNNLGLLHAINAQRLNVGGKVKNGIQYAMAGFKIGNIPGYSAATNAVAAKLAGVGQSVQRRGVSTAVSGKVKGEKNNLVYLLKPSNNQQLTGIRTMKEFDKRGVPIDVLRKDMVSEEGLWMIDALAKGNWKKDAYKSTLENNFASIAAKYPGKEIRFLDSLGLERIQPLLGKPEYQNVQFVSVKELQNKELLNNLSSDHLERLMTEATQVTSKLRTSKSRGTTSVKDTYEGIPGMESYTKIQESWRGTKRPPGRHGAHMYNMGGKVDDVQKLSKGSLVRDLRSTFAKSLLFGAFHRGHKGKATITGVENMLESMWKKTGFTQKGKQRGSLFTKTAINERKKMLIEQGLDEKIANQLASKPLRQAIELAKEKKVAFYATGFGGGTSGVLGARYNFLMEDLFQVKKGYGKFFKHDKAREAAKDIPDYILEGSFPLTPKDAQITAKALGKMGNEKQLKKMLQELNDLSKIDQQDYLQLIRNRIEPVHIGAGGKADELDFIFNNLPKNYTAKDILRNIYNISNPGLSGNVKGKFTTYSSSNKSAMGKEGFTQPVGNVVKNAGFLATSFLNKGGMIPGVEYANIGKMIGKAMGPNADDALGAFGLLKPKVRTGAKPKIPENSTMQEILNHKEFKEGIYLIKPEGGQAYEAMLYYHNGKPRLQRYGQYNVGTGVGSRTSQYDAIDVDPNMRASIYNRNEYTGSNVSVPFKAFNKGNIVPGTGNTDTVPAMLTPGEFVINKESTKQNYDLLTAINNGQNLNVGGKVKGYAIGGVVKTGLRGVAGIGAGFAATAGLEGMGMGTMLSSILGFTIGPALASSKGLGLIAKAATPLVSALGLSTKALMGVIGPIAVVSIGMIALNKMANNAVQSGGELIKSMYGSSERMKEFAKAFGRENTQQTLARQRAELAAGAPIGQEAQQYSTQFLESGAGATLLKDLQDVSKVSGTAGRDQALLSQLTRGIVTGSITAEEARAIALDVGKKLGDQSIGIKLGAQISDLVGPDGKKVTDNILKINAIISPQINMEKIGKDVSKQWENLGIGSKLGMILTGKGTDDMIVDALAQAAIEANSITSEQLDLLRLELENGNISIQEFTSKKDAITAQSNKTTLDAIETINKKYGEGTDKALNALREFRKEFEKEFKTKISVLSEEDQKYAETAQKQLRINKESFADAKTLSSEVTSKVFNEDLNKQRQELEKLGLDPNLATADFIGLKQQLELALADESLRKIVAEKLFGPETKAEIADKAGDALAGLDEHFNAAIGKLLDEDKTGQLKEKLINLFKVDPETFAKFQNLFDIGGPDALAKALTMGEDELSKYLDNVSKLSALPAELKDGIDIDKLLGDPDKLNAFIEETGKVKEILDEIKKNKNLSISAKMKLVADKFGKDSPMYKLLVEGQKKGLSIETLLDFGVTDEGKKVAAAYATLENPDSSPPARREALRVIGEFESKGAKDLKATQEGGDEGAKSALQTAKDAARQTKESIAAQSKLLAAGISLEALEGLSPEAIIELSKQSGKQLRDNIKLFNEQAESIKINKLALEQLALEENPIKKALEDSKKTVEGYDNQIKELNKTIEKSNRADELDRRRIEDKNKALENLTKKEKNVNDQYNERIKALDKVANANDRVAEKQRQQVDLASALTSGDIAGAAKAAAAMTETDAEYQIEDTKTALEAQRQAELDGLTESVNGKLMTRKDIQAEIDAIEETIYQRNINLRSESDQIYELQQKINYQKDLQYDLNETLKEQEKVQVENAKKKYQFEKDTTAQAKARAKIEFASFLRLKGMKESEVQKRVAEVNFAFGGMVKKYSFGGNVGYKGSTEAPPALKMARGSLVPGLGNTDRVPALLTPGEFVVRKSVAKANMPLLKALNSDVFPSMSLNTPDVAPTVTSSTSTILNNTPVYNYSISVNVPNTTASPDEIANVVVSRIKRSMDTNIRSNRY
jgi:TP901 family phage tail tape measure protein